jgi:predicted sulfurtransferase
MKKTTAKDDSDSDDSDSDASEARQLLIEKKQAKKVKKQKKKEKKEKKKRKRDLETEEKETATAGRNEEEDRKEKKQAKKEKKKRKRDQENQPEHQQQCPKYSTDDKIIESSHLDFRTDHTSLEDANDLSLLLFYQYVEPAWPNDVYKAALKHVEQLGHDNNVMGRMRVAKEGLNCTLTGQREGIFGFCQALRDWKPAAFGTTEFKVTHHLPDSQKFGNLKIMPVTELVNYGLDGAKAPPIQQYHGTHLEPTLYHEKIAENNTVIIDVRNHYEATIGHFEPPSASNDQSDEKKKKAKVAATTGDNDNGETPPVWLNPKMRKSTEFPAWLDDPATQQQLQGKQVLMYCTGK